MNFERERDVAETTILWISPDLKPQFPTHFQRHGIFLKDLAVYPFQAFLAYSMINCIRVQPKPANRSIIQFQRKMARSPSSASRGFRQREERQTCPGYPPSGSTGGNDRHDPVSRQLLYEQISQRGLHQLQQENRGSQFTSERSPA